MSSISLVVGRCVSIFDCFDCTSWRDSTIFPLSFFIDCGKYLAAFEYVKPVQVAKLPAFMDLSQVDLIEKLAAKCRYLTSASTLVRSYALKDVRFVCFVSGLGCRRAVLLGLKVKRHNFDMTFS